MTMTSPIFGRAANTTTSATRYAGIQYNYLDSWNATATNVEQVAPDSGTLQNLYVTLGTAPGVGAGYTFTVTKNGSTTALTCSITGTNTSSSDTVNTVSYSAGDTLGIQSSIQSGTPAAGSPRWAVENVGTAQNLFTRASVSQNSTMYVGLQAGSATATANLAQSLMPTAGTIAASRIKLTGAPSAGSVTFTLVVNGVDSAMAITISNPAATGSSSTSVAVSAGDRVYWKVVTGAATGSIVSSIGTLFTATTSGESVQLFSPSTALGASGNNYMPLTSGTGGAATVEVNRLPQNSATAWTLSKLYVNLNTAPGGAASYTATVRSNSANTAVTTTITGASTTGNDTIHSATAAASAAPLGINIVGASTPAASVAQASFVTFLTPTSSSTGNFFQFF